MTILITSVKGRNMKELSEIEKLIMYAKMLHDEIQACAKNEKFNENIQLRLDDLSYEVYKIKANLNKIKYYLVE